MLSGALCLLIAAGQPQTICIDPGHPSEVGNGSHGKKLTEIHANWLMAKALEKRLVAKGFKVVLTKHSEKEFVANKRRAEIANLSHANLLIRLHCDGSPGSGYAVYYPEAPGHDGKVIGPSESVRKRSRIAAAAFYKGFSHHPDLELLNNGLKTDRQTAVGKKNGALAGSIYSKVPVFLIEMATLTNSKDEAYLSSESGQATVADALEGGVEKALEALSRA